MPKDRSLPVELELAHFQASSCDKCGSTFWRHGYYQKNRKCCYRNNCSSSINQNTPAFDIPHLPATLHSNLNQEELRNHYDTDDWVVDSVLLGMRMTYFHDTDGTDPHLEALIVSQKFDGYKESFPREFNGKKAKGRRTSSSGAHS